MLSAVRLRLSVIPLLLLLKNWVINVLLVDFKLQILVLNDAVKDIIIAIICDKTYTCIEG